MKTDTTLFFTEIKNAALREKLGIFVLTLVWSTKGLCRVIFGPQSRIRDDAHLNKHFAPFALKPKEHLQNDPSLKILQQYAQGKKQLNYSELNKKIVFDMRGTTFQKSVWRAMAKIPQGEIATYGTLARKINRPKASRAIGAACGANPLSLLVPCHRVIGGQGKLVGFASGLPLKKRLLGHEGVST